MDCPTCGRAFKSESSCHQHCRDTHPKTYCFRCQRPFARRQDLVKHVTDSSRHHRCEQCPHRPDFETRTDLDDHEVLKHSTCRDCSRTFGSQASLQQHEVDAHNLCIECRQSFDTPNSLKQVGTPYVLHFCMMGLMSRSISGSTCRRLSTVQVARISTTARLLCFST